MDFTLQVISKTIFSQLWTVTQATVSKHWRRVVSHPDSSQSHQAHLTMLQ